MSAQTLEDAQLALSDLGATLDRDYDGDPYVSIPVGYQLAVEIERGNGVAYDVLVLGWDRTGGVNYEDEVGTATTTDEAVKLARTRAEQILAEQARLAAKENAHFAEED